MTDEPNGQMNEMDFLRAQFFSSDADFAAAKAAETEKKERANQRRRERAKSTYGIRALGRFAKVLESLDESERQANIKWLADKYLGIKLWRW